MATIALALYIIFQLIQSKKQVVNMKENHLVHLEESIKDHIDLHERREMEQGRQMVEALGRIERELISMNKGKR